MIEDVPRGYVRDKLMAYIMYTVADKLEDGGQSAMRYLCSDLDDSQIEEYRSLIRADGTVLVYPTYYTVKQVEAAERILAANKGNTMMRRFDQAIKVVLLDEALEKVDDSVNYERPKHIFGLRRDGPPLGLKLISNSVVLPDSLPLPAERTVSLASQIDRDCR